MICLSMLIRIFLQRTENCSLFVVLNPRRISPPRVIFCAFSLSCKYFVSLPSILLWTERKDKILFFSPSVASFPNDLRQVEDKYFRGWPNFNALPTSVQYFAVRLDLVLYSRMCCNPFPSRVVQKVFQGGFNYFQLFSSEKASLCIF